MNDSGKTTGTMYTVVAQDCLRCGACSSFAPGIIEMGEKVAVFVRQPVTTKEITATQAALFCCPVSAIRKVRSS